METLIFATHNANKAKEIKQLLPHGYTLESLDDIGLHDDIPETGTTLEENALIKARYVYQKTGKACFADDTGLEVDSLDGAPGVYSARYAGEKATYQDNVIKLLEALGSETNRDAQFRTVIAHINEDGNEELFDGIAEGTITAAQLGEEGFGYDPIFLPKGHNQTFAEMDSASKNAISHRGRAFEKFIQALSQA